MPPKKRAHVDEFDLELNETRIQEERQRSKEIAREGRKSQQRLSRLKESASLGSEATPDELMAFEILKVGCLKTVMLAVQVVRDVGHLGPVALSHSCNAVGKSESERSQLLDSCQRISSLQADFLDSFPSSSAVILAPKKVACEDGHDVFEFSTGEVNCFELTKKTRCFVLRAYCRKCKITFGPWASDQSKSKKKKKKSNCKRFYYADADVSFVEVNEKNFIHKSMMEFFVCQMHHTWASFQGFSEAYTEALYNLASRSGIEFSEQGCRLSRKLLSSAFYEYEIWVSFLEQEQSSAIIKERNLNLEEFIGESSFQERGLYQHDQRTTQCDKKGCDFAHVADGLWKLQYTLCMFQQKVTGPLGITYPTNCRDEPTFGKAFCRKHCELMSQQGYPTDLKSIVERLGRTGKDVAVDFYENVNEASVRREQFRREGRGEEATAAASNAIHVPTTRSQSRKQLSEEIQDDLMVHATEIEPDGSRSHELLRRADLMSTSKSSNDCFKNVGGRKRISHWLRGHFFIVAPCGHILRWEPLFGSESPSQAFAIFVDHLVDFFKTQKPEPADWENFSLVYDNICHVDNLKAASRKLPEEVYPAPYDEVWMRINKVIDRLHVRNHQKKCQQKYGPEILDRLEPETSVNTMRCEQTFVWLGRFKKILCAMPKTHHHFTLNRLVVRRNAYTHWKNMSDQNVLLPKVRSSRTT